MRPARRLASIALLSAAGLILSGCVPADPEVTPPAEPSSEAIFASDEEALAAATDAYEAYLKMSDLIAQEGGKNPERIAPLVTEEWLATEVEAFGGQVETGLHQVGAITYRSAELQQFDSGPSGTLHIAAYFCMDISGTKFFTSGGSDVTPQDRESLVAIEVSFLGQPDAAELLIGGIEPWPSAGIC